MRRGEVATNQPTTALTAEMDPAPVRKAFLLGDHDVWSFMSVRSRLFTRRSAAAAGALGVTGALVAAGTIVSAQAAELPTVTLTVDGQSTSLTSPAATVGGLLSQQDVSVDGNDAVYPGPSQPLESGMTISVNHRALVSVRQNGVRQRHLVSADTVAQLKDELQLPARNSAAVAAAATRPATWMRTLVERPNGALIAGGDRVVERATARVERVHIAYVTRRRDLQPRAISKQSPLLESGKVRVLKRGRDGRVVVQYRKKRVDGKLVKRRVIARNVVRKATRRVVVRGTGPNWTALARCESGNNPRAVNPAGYYGLYQFSLSTWNAVGGRGNPIDATRMEQTKRAWILYRQSGPGPWPVCGAYL